LRRPNHHYGHKPELEKLFENFKKLKEHWIQKSQNIEIVHDKKKMKIFGKPKLKKKRKFGTKISKY